MAYTRLYLLVEGDDDERFVQRTIIPRLRSSYDWVQPWKYSDKKPEKVNRFLRSIKAMGGDYFLIGDLNAYGCFPKKRERLLKAFARLDAKQTVIVAKEIESWYLAGVPDNNPLGITVPRDTSNLTKEQFNATTPRGFDSRIDYMVEVLKLFDVEVATKRNSSFHYFARRCGIC